MTEISVVVPVYNTGRWLREALASVDEQDCRAGVEVIVVDDGSTDDSTEIARDYASRRPSTQYVRQRNAGLGAARNRGLGLASGRYLAFLDSDDRYAPGGLDALLAAAGRAADADVVIGDMLGMPPRPSPPWRRDVVVGDRVIGSLAEAPDLVGNVSACNKLFSRELVTAAGARFAEGTAFEDVLFTLPLLLDARRLAVTDRLCYLYRARDDGSSIMDSRGRPERIMEHLSAVEALAARCRDRAPHVRRAVLRWIGYVQLHYAWRAAGSLGDDQLAEFAERMSVLFTEIPPEIVAEYVPSLRAGLRAVGVYRGDAELIRAPVSSAGLRVLRDRVYLDLPELDVFGELLRARPLSATITRIRRAGGEIRIHGQVEIPGLRAVEGATRSDVLLEVGDAIVRRAVRVTGAKNGRFHWACDIPRRILPLGGTAVRLVVRDRSGAESEIPLTAEETAAISFHDRRVRLHTSTGGPACAVTFVVTRGHVFRHLGMAVRRRVRSGD